MVRKLLGLSPQPTSDGAYSPSKLALKMATSDVTDYSKVSYRNSIKDKNLRILVMCTEESQLTMKNGKKFSTGNHPVETLVPMLHLKDAGFEFDIYTPTGKPAQIEMWAMPTKDQNVVAFYNNLKSQLDKPNSLADLAARNFENNCTYAAIYFPGGHGALIGLPDNKNVGDLIKWAFKKDIFHLSICHGPATLLAAKPISDSEAFLFRGYKIAAFPDAVDRQTPLIGYMPGQLTWHFGEQLKKLGVTIMNSKADNSCFVDRKLITGASPKAANDFGKLAATTMLEHFNPGPQLGILPKAGVP